MIRLIAFFCGLMVATATYAADLGKPAVAAPATLVAMLPAAVPDQWTGLYFEGGYASRFTDTSKHTATGKIGIGYTYHALGNPWVGGVFARYGFSIDGDSDAAILTFDQPVTLGARIGYLVQPSTYLYGVFGYSFGKDNDKGAILGLGAEAPVLGKLRLALEYHAQFEDFKASSDVIHEIGLYARIPF